MRTGSISYASLNGVYVVKFSGEIRVPLCTNLNDFGDEILKDPALLGVAIDLTAVKSIDSTALGLLVKIAIGMEELGLDRPLIISTDVNVNRTLEMTGFQQIFHILEQLPSSLADANVMLHDLPNPANPNVDLCEQVLEAHRILMNLNDKNKEVFTPVVQALENEKRQSTKPQ